MRRAAVLAAAVVALFGLAHPREEHEPPARKRAPERPPVVDQVEVSGVVAGAEVVAAGPLASSVVRVLLLASDEVVPVLLGPLWQVEDSGLSLDDGELLTVTGTWTTFGGEVTLQAKTVEQAGVTATFDQAAGLY